MAVEPGSTTMLTQLRACLKAIYRVLTPNVNVSEYGTHQQAAPPYWTTNIYKGRLNRDGDGAGISEFNLTVTCTYHAGRLTARETVEDTAQTVLIAGLLEFAQRPRLQSSTYPNGVLAIDEEGITEVDGEVNTAGGTSDTPTDLVTRFTFTLPLQFDFDELEF